jgi:parallel beta-helix repeat protein
MKQTIWTLLVVVLSVRSLNGQSCRSSVMTGAAASVGPTVGFVAGGTPLSTDTINGAYYEVTNGAGLGQNPVVRTMYSNRVQTAGQNSRGCNNCDPSDSHPVVYGGAFINPTNAPITVTGVTFTTHIDHFTPAISLGVSPLGGWDFVNRRMVRWSGTVSVPARGGQNFIVLDTPQNNATNNSTRTAQLRMTVTTSAGTFDAPVFNMNAVTASTNRASNAMVTFDTFGLPIPIPQVFVDDVPATGPVNLSVRVAETGNNGSNSAIDTGLQLTVTVPAGWSAVSVPVIGSPWSGSTLSIVQPTATADGLIAIRTNQRIDQGSTTGANSLVIRATPPQSSATNLHPFRLSLSGRSRRGLPIDSFNDSVVQVLGNGSGTAISTEFLGAALAAPVRAIEFRADFNVIQGNGTDPVNVQVFNRNTSQWETLSSVTPGSSNVTVTRTFGADFEPYVDATNRMRVRFMTAGTSVRTLRIDHLRWTTAIGYTVDNSTGSDTAPGHVARPFRTLARAAAALAAGGAVYVEVGSSQAGTPYDANVVLSASGSSGCQTLFQGVTASGQRPRVRGITAVNPNGTIADFGVDIAGNHIVVDGFQIENTGAGIVVEPDSENVVASNNDVRLATNGMGIVLTSARDAVIANNTLTAGGNAPLFGILDGGRSRQTLIEGNRITGVASGFGIHVDGISPAIRRNILSNQFAGIWLEGTTGNATIQNNTVDRTVLAALQLQNPAAVHSRNNIFVNGGYGIRHQGTGSVNSDYDDVFNNMINYQGASAGANSRSANPLFLQTVDPTLSTYYGLNGGSPCIDAGTNVGLAFHGAAPDLGAVESQ